MLLAGAGLRARQHPASSSRCCSCSGVQAAFFGPVKYGILPELLAEDELMGGNALIEAGTFLAILIGTIAGGLLILVPHGPAIVVARRCSSWRCGGWVASLYIPRGRAAAPELRINPEHRWPRPGDPRLCLSPAAICAGRSSASRGSGSSASPICRNSRTTPRTSLGANNQVVTLFLTLFSVGIGVGSLLCGRLQRGQIMRGWCRWARWAWPSSGSISGSPGGCASVRHARSTRRSSWRCRRIGASSSISSPSRSAGGALRRAALRHHAGAQRERAPRARRRRQQHHERAVHGAGAGS